MLKDTLNILKYFVSSLNILIVKDGCTIDLVFEIYIYFQFIMFTQ